MFKARWFQVMKSTSVLLLALLGCVNAFAAPTADAILSASEAIRNPGRSFSVTVTLTDFQGGKQVDTSTLQSYSRLLATGQYSSLVRFVLPVRDAGKLMLKNGNDMWFYDPTNKASVRLSPQQRLLGQASNGDVATVNLAQDYKPRLLGEEEVQNGERQIRRSYKLALTAESSDVTYASIEMWVDAENNRPIKARFFAESTRLLKTVYYRKYESQLGTQRPTESVIIDGLDPKAVTLMRFTGYISRDIPETWMQRDYLPHFQP